MRHYYKINNTRFNLLGQKRIRKKDGLKATEQFLESIGMLLRLSDLGCKLEDTEIITDLVIKSSPPSLKLTAASIAEIYRDSFK